MTLPMIFSSPIGNLSLTVDNNKLVGIAFLSKKTAPTSATDSTSKHICKELKSYFQNPGHVFDIDLDLEGTDFQKRVWKRLTEIPSGTTVSYNTIAKALKTSPRAVGNACRANPIPVVIPCHRVVAQNHIGGYAGKTDGEILDIKKWLLAHEKGHV